MPQKSSDDLGPTLREPVLPGPIVLILRAMKVGRLQSILRGVVTELRAEPADGCRVIVLEGLTWVIPPESTERVE